mmetsp:Transcript_3068/g.11436  ORF Transcript_3068/g.11436 Transcript_3068/m.11436 type:complete len:213 (-) Transcript_3068:944-1582(-)
MPHVCSWASTRFMPWRLSPVWPLLRCSAGRSTQWRQPSIIRHISWRSPVPVAWAMSLATSHRASSSHSPSISVDQFHWDPVACAPRAAPLSPAAASKSVARFRGEVPRRGAKFFRMASSRVACRGERRVGIAESTASLPRERVGGVGDVGAPASLEVMAFAPAVTAAPPGEAASSPAACVCGLDGTVGAGDGAAWPAASMWSRRASAAAAAS